MWTAQTHPLEYPKAGILTGPHFSGVIGASHGRDFTLFADGRMPSPGLERLSEEGKHAPLDAEIMAAVACVREGHASSPDQIREYMSGNICRCGAYVGIVAAIQQAAPEVGRA